jgi:enoyl-CoA hydratase
LETDVTIAAEDALFTHPGWRYIGPTTDVWLLMQTIGIKRAKEMMLTGTPIDAHKALEYGLVNKVVPSDKLEEEGEKMAQSMALLPFDGIVMGKVQFEAALDAMGMGSGYTAAYIMHAMQTGIRYEPGEFNLLKERKDKGVKGATAGRKRYYKEGYLV